MRPNINFHLVFKEVGFESFIKFVAQNYCNSECTLLHNYTPLRLNNVGWAEEYK